jgi:hypothetical protein
LVYASSNDEEDDNDAASSKLGVISRRMIWKAKFCHQQSKHVEDKKEDEE